MNSMVDLVCPCCGISGEELRSIVGLRDRGEIVRCKSCEHVFSSPAPTKLELQEYYSGFMYRSSDSKMLLALRDIRRFVSWWNRDVLCSVRDKKVLDYGGGIGVASIAFLLMGASSVVLVDLDPKSLKLALELAKVVGVEDRLVIQNEIADSSDEDFDLVVLNHVAEHLVSPLDDLIQIRGLLGRQGELFISTPNLKSLEVYLRPQMFYYYTLGFGLRGSAFRGVLSFLCSPWSCCDPPRHLHSFSVSSLSVLLRRAGFKVGKVFYEYGWEGKFTSPIKLPAFGFKPVVLLKISLYWVYVLLSYFIQRSNRSNFGVLARLSS